jgi:hypothetical protein
MPISQRTRRDNPEGMGDTDNSPLAYLAPHSERMTLLADLEAFVQDHRPHGSLTVDATEPAVYIEWSWRRRRRVLIARITPSLTILIILHHATRTTTTMIARTSTTWPMPPSACCTWAM